MLYSTVLFMMTKRLRTKNNYPQRLSGSHQFSTELGLVIRSDNQTVVFSKFTVFVTVTFWLLPRVTGNEKRLKLIVK